MKVKEEEEFMNAQKVISLYESGHRNFSGKELQGVSFKGKNLSGANFTGANLNEADFTNAIVNGTKFDNAHLTSANFSHAQCGLPRSSAIVLILSSWLFSGLSGLMWILNGTLILLIFSPNFHVKVTGWSGLIVIATFFLITFFKGLRIEVVVASLAVAGIIIVVATGAIAVGAAGIIDTTVGIPLAIDIAIGGAGSVGVAVGAAIVGIIGIVTSVTVGGQISGSVAIVISIIFATIGCLIGTIEVSLKAMKYLNLIVDIDNVAKIEVLVVGIAIAIGILFNIYISRQTIKGKGKLKEKYLWVNNIAIILASIRSTSFRNAYLNKTDFTQAKLKNNDFRGALLTHTKFTQAKIVDDVQSEVSYLRNKQIRQVLITGEGQGENFDHLDIRGVNLKDVNLQNTSFIEADLSNVILQGANLQQAKLVRTNLHDTDLTGAVLTGACIDNWGRTATTKIEDITCEYIYMKLSNNKFEHRQPPYKKNFNREDFQYFMTQCFDTLDFFHKNEFDFLAAYRTIMIIQEENPEHRIGLSNIKSCGDNNYIVQIDVSENVDREAIRDKYNHGYYDYSCFLKYQKKQLNQLKFYISSNNTNQLTKLITGRTEHRVLIKLGKGDFNEGFSSVRINVDLLNRGFTMDRGGKLPANPQLRELYSKLMETYLFTEDKKQDENRAKKKEGNPNNISSDEIRKRTQQIQTNREQISKLERAIKANIDTWLGSDEFSPILEFMRSKLNNKLEEILICIDTEPDLIDPDQSEIDNYTLLRKMPWHLWNILDEYPNMEIAFTKPDRERQEPRLKRTCPRVLSILGNDIGIDVGKDKNLLEQNLSGAEIVFLEKKTKNEIVHSLNNPQGWDIICFSGHRSDKWNELAINSDETISAQELKHNLVKALNNGLQLIILNACDTLRLARELENLHIPQVIVMKENVPDIIAHKFLESFLKFFKDNSVAISMRKAREEMSQDDPIGAWIPALCQNASEGQLTFNDLLIRSSNEST